MEKENGVREVQLIKQAKDGKQKFVINAGNVVELINDGAVIEVENRGAKDINVQPGNGWIVAATTSTLVSTPVKDKSHQKLERALIVPRFNRDNPPSHILVAKTGDMKRGKFLDFQGQAIQFDSKLREFSVPIDRVARVVNISRSSSQPSVSISRQRISSQPSAVSRQQRGRLLTKKPLIADSRQPTANSHSQSEIRVTLTDGSMLIFEPLQVQNGRLFGRSSIYGEVSVPVNSIRYLYFGGKAKSFTAAFEKWTVRPAKEPTYDDDEILPADQ